jgi:ATP-binding cassette, subfamily F, member 1
MQSIDALCDALEDFEGGVIVISHDAQLLSRLCADEERSEVWLVEDGRVDKYPGDFEDYRSSLAKEIVAELDDQAAQEQAAREAEEERKRTTLDLSGLTI